jgi:hypothetical protein
VLRAALAFDYAIFLVCIAHIQDNAKALDFERSTQQSMAHFTTDYEDLYMQEEFSDVTLVIRDENETAGAAGQKRKRKSSARTLPGHCLLLRGYSGYCKAKVI